ncbi:MAG: hypothetical protein ORN57_05090, partial [Alphaproteobacteria bacterium]|nr:hypothetical protein [Alphaproteobacteria bacterium]
PVLDIRFEGAHDIIGDRAFGDKAEEVIAVVAPFLAALERHGLLTVMKHIPGHGRALVDSHHYLPRVAAKRALLEQTDFLPFQFFAHQAETRVPFAMTAHVVYEDIDPLWPATLSPLVMAMIRDHIGFNGLVMTDDLSMKALAQLEGKTMADRVRLALAAGCDLMLHCNGDRAEMTAVVETIRASDWRPADMEKKYQALAGYYEKIKSTSPTPLDERARLSAYQEMESLLLPYWQARH